MPIALRPLNHFNQRLAIEPPGFPRALLLAAWYLHAPDRSQISRLENSVAGMPPSRLANEHSKSGNTRPARDRRRSARVNHLLTHKEPDARKSARRRGANILRKMNARPIHGARVLDRRAPLVCGLLEYLDRI